MKDVSEKENIEYWNKFYKSVMIDGESSFCTFVKKQLPSTYFTIDIGCGSGRDTKAFARDGYKVIGVDRSTEVIQANNEIVSNIMSINFATIDVGNVQEFEFFLKENKKKAEKENQKVLIYSRFFFHSINDNTEEVMLNSLCASLQKGDKLALEFRTLEDKHIGKVYGNHYRRFIDSDALKKALIEKYSFTINYFYKGQGLSIYKDEDPYLARIICTKN